MIAPLVGRGGWLTCSLLSIQSLEFEERAYDAASREVDREKDAMLDEIGRRLEQKTECSKLFTLRWRVA